MTGKWSLVFVILFLMISISEYVMSFFVHSIALKIMHGFFYVFVHGCLNEKKIWLNFEWPSLSVAMTTKNWFLGKTASEGQQAELSWTHYMLLSCPELVCSIFGFEYRVIIARAV